MPTTYLPVLQPFGYTACVHQRASHRWIGSGLVALWMHCGHLLYVCRRYGILQPYSVVLGPSVCIRQERAFADEYCWCICADVEHHAVWAGTAPPRPACYHHSRTVRVPPRTHVSAAECRRARPRRRRMKRPGRTAACEPSTHRECAGYSGGNIRVFSSNADALAQHVRALSRFGNGIASTVRSYAML